MGVQDYRQRKSARLDQVKKVKTNKDYKVGNLSRIPYKNPDDFPSLTNENDLQNPEMSKRMQDFHTDQLKLDNPEDKEKYEWIMRNTLRSVFFVNYIKRYWVEEEKTVIVHIEWGEMYRQRTDKAQKSIDDDLNKSKHLST